MTVKFKMFPGDQQDGSGMKTLAVQAQLPEFRPRTYIKVEERKERTEPTELCSDLYIPGMWAPPHSETRYTHTYTIIKIKSFIYMQYNHNMGYFFAIYRSIYNYDLGMNKTIW